MVNPSPVICTWSRRRDSNPEPAVYKTAALPIELRRRGAGSYRRWTLRRRGMIRSAARAGQARPSVATGPANATATVVSGGPAVSRPAGRPAGDRRPQAPWPDPHRGSDAPGPPVDPRRAGPALGHPGPAPGAVRASWLGPSRAPGDGVDGLPTASRTRLRFAGRGGLGLGRIRRRGRVAGAASAGSFDLGGVDAVVGRGVRACRPGCSATASGPRRRGRRSPALLRRRHRVGAGCSAAVASGASGASVPACPLRGGSASDDASAISSKVGGSRSIGAVPAGIPLGDRREQQDRAGDGRVERADRAAHRDPDRDRSARRRTAGDRPWPSLPTTIASGPRRSAWARRQRGVGLGRGDPQAADPEVRTAPAADRRPGRAGGARPRPADALIAAGDSGAWRWVGKRTPWTPAASALRSSVPTFCGILERVEDEHERRLAALDGPGEDVVEAGVRRAARRRARCPGGRRSRRPR